MTSKISYCAEQYKEEENLCMKNRKTLETMAR